MKNVKFKGSFYGALLFAVGILSWAINASLVSATVPYSNYLISKNTSGNAGNSYSTFSSVSKDGRYVVFTSNSSDIVSSDTNNKSDVFLSDRSTGSISRISVSTSGTQADNESSGRVSITSDGRFVIFESLASNLVSGDTNGSVDVFLRDTQANTTEAISASPSGTIGSGASSIGGLSRDARYVVFSSTSYNFTSDSSNNSDVFLKDRKLNTLSKVSKNTSGGESNNHSGNPSISCDGAYIVYSSYASDLVSSDTNNKNDIFVVDRIEDTTKNITLSGNNNSDTPLISCSGETATFASLASNLVSSDTNAVGDIFAYDLSSEATSRVSVSSSGTQGDAISGVNYSYAPVSANGRCVVFTSNATNLVSSDSNGIGDVFIHNRNSQTTERISMYSSSQQIVAWAGPSKYPNFSADGKFASFYTGADLNSSQDTNGNYDIYLSETGLTDCSL